MIYSFRIECCLSQSEHNTYTCKRIEKACTTIWAFFNRLFIWYLVFLGFAETVILIYTLWSTCSLPPLPRRKAGHSAVRDYFDTVHFQSVCLFNSYRARVYTGKLGLHLDDRQDSAADIPARVCERKSKILHEWLNSCTVTLRDT